MLQAERAACAKAQGGEELGTLKNGKEVGVAEMQRKNSGEGERQRPCHREPQRVSRGC